MSRGGDAVNRGVRRHAPALAAATAGALLVSGCSAFGGAPEDAYPVQATARGITPEFTVEVRGDALVVGYTLENAGQEPVIGSTRVEPGQEHEGVMEAPLPVQAKAPGCSTPEALPERVTFA